MNLGKIACGVCCVMALGAWPCAAASSVAAAEEPSMDSGSAAPATAEKAPVPASAAEKPGATWKSPAAHGYGKSHRLKFRGPDGTCACDCASGGISEADIRNSEEGKKSASR